jgi:hypothetical protein
LLVSVIADSATHRSLGDILKTSAGLRRCRSDPARQPAAARSHAHQRGVGTSTVLRADYGATGRKLGAVCQQSLSPVAIVIAVQVTLIVVDIALIAADVAELGIQSTLVASQICSITCRGVLPAAPDIPVQSRPNARDIGLHRIHPHVVATQITVVTAEILPLVIAIVPILR